MEKETEDFVEVAEKMPTDFYLKCAKHFLKALRKHPRFADALFVEGVEKDAKCALEQTRCELDYLTAHNWLDCESLARCEIAEAQLANAQGDAAACVDELYDAVAVLMRMIAVIEGKQKLGGAE